MALSPELPQLQRSHAHIPGLSCNIRANYLALKFGQLYRLHTKNDYYPADFVAGIDAH